MHEPAFTLPSLVEVERKHLLSQRKKAYSLIFLMIMLAQTSYIGALEGWKYLDQTNASNIGPGCDLIARTSGTPIHVDPEIGSNDWNGTWSCPLATLQEAINVSSANDEIILASGLYHENVSISNKDNLLIRAADGATVVFDGTRSIANDMNVTWSTADSDGIQEVTLPQDGWQLFLAYDEQVPARWPNAGFDDKTVFNRSYWAEGTLTGSNNAYTKGWLTDAGPETGVHTGLNETVNASGLDPVGAIAIMNLGSFRSNSRIITDWNPNNGTFAYDGDDVGWKTKHHAYFLEGKRELIDVDGEWWYNNTNNRLHYKTPSGQDANDLDLRVKVQPFAISVDGSDGVTIQGIDFFGTTVNFNNCDGCSFTNATLEYPSTSKRGLGIAGESEDDRWMTRFYRSTNSFIDNISITNTDGGAIEFHGSGGQSNNNTINNSYFYAIDWSAADQKGLMTTIYEGGRDMYFMNNTVHLTGASSVLSIGDAPKVFYNEVWDVGHLQTDGAVVQVMQGEAPGAEIAYNWIHDVIKYGARFDAPIGQAGEGRNGTMHHNVIWNAAGGLMVKGDYHDIHNNTVFNSSAGKNDIIFLTDGGINNKNSTLHRNAVDSVADHRSDDVFVNPLPNGSHWSNWNGYLQGYDDMFEARNQISCAIYDNGSLYCWGRNDHGQLGLGYTSGREELPQFVDFGSGRTITSLGIGHSGAEGWTPNSHACAVLDNGDLVCWGANGDGQLGIGNTSTNGVWEPTTVNVGSGLTAISVATGNSATCVLLSDYSVKCWGKNNLGQLGLGNSSSNDVLTPHAVTFSGSSTPLSLHAGRNEFCAQLDNGSAACWGQNADGQFGLGNTTSQTSPIALTLPTGRTIASMSLAKDFICMTLDNGSVVCAGRNTEFQIGQGTTSTAELSWKYVVGLDMVAHTVDLGQDVGCAHLVNGSMVCWGEDVWGFFGNSASSYTWRSATTASEYVDFGDDRTAASISVNYRHACAVLDTGDLTCWGRNHKYQLGLGNMTQQFMPVVVSNVSSIRQVQIHEMLVDPANDDFRPKWGSQLHQLGAGAYDAGDADPWTAGVSWTYSPMSDPISGCMDSIAINYNSNAIFGDGSCTYTALSSSSSTLSLEMNTAITPYTLTYSTPFLADDKQTAASSGSVGAGTNIALDSNGAVHICSKTVTTDNLYYTTNASGSWQSATLDSSGNVGGDCFIILDSDDDIHITYHDSSNSNLKYATKALSSAIAASNWAISTMDNNGNVGNFGSMAVDANDTLHVAYYSANGAALKYATLADGSTTWSKEVVESTNDVGKYTSIALDSNGNPHITYHDDTNDDLRYTHKMGSSWAFTTLDSVGVTGKGTSLAIDSNDHLHVAYRTNSTEIAYMTNRSGSWVKTTLDANSTGIWGVNYINLMLDEGDDPHVVYSDMADYDIFYMSNTRGTWERVLVAGDSTSKTSEATMDENGGIHVAYYIDGSFDDIGYAAVRSLAHRPQFEIEPDLPNGVFLGAENGTIYGTPSEFLDLTEYTVWANTTRTSAFTTFSMNVDWELMSSVDYLETPRNTAITPITFNWTAWTSGVLNSTSSLYTSGNSGDYNSIAVDSNDKVHIVFYRDDNSNLYHATNASGSWSTSSIETNNNVGKYCSIAIDSNDGLHVSYQYNTGNALKYAYKASGSTTWSRTTVDNTGGKFTSIAVDSNDKPHIAYRDSGGDVGYAEKTGSSWTFGTVQTAGNIASASIAIDSDDHIHIAYYDSNNKDMFHLTNTSGSWARTFLDDIGSHAGGMAVDIAIDPTTDRPGVSYFDSTATALGYTYYTGSTWPLATVENGADYGRFNSIAYDSLGNVHISHERNSADDLYYTSDKTGSWVSTAIDTANSVGLYTAMAVDSNDDVHIAYRYNTGYDVRHATVQGYKTGSVARTAVTGATCSISPSLPNGLNLNPGTCTISGTPSSYGSNLTYNLTATSSTGVSKSGEFKIWVTPIAPSIAYTGSPFTFSVGTPITSITPSNTGDSAFWGVSPSLPSGLSLSSSGVISGTPTAAFTTALYNITASNPGGESTATISITVNAQAPSGLSYATENMTLTQGVTMTNNNPSVSGGSVTSWEISPSIPSGMSFSSSTGVISGSPNYLQTTKTTYTVWANNSGGSASANVNITINAAAPHSLSYSPQNKTLTKGVAMSTWFPSVSGGTTTSFEISPSIPGGLSFNSGTGHITGTPTVLQTTAVTYTVWANNSGGSTTAQINITINDVAPNTIIYSSHDLTLEKGTAMTTTTPAISGGSATIWEISPSIPSGLSFSSTTGAISGTPSSLQTTAVAYTIWANNSGGSTSTQMNITINDQIASVSYPSTVEISNDRTMTTVTPTNTGGAVISWVIVPSLPSGLNFGSSNGSIWGTPSGLLTNVTYTVYANNSGGSNSTTFTLGLNWTLTPSAEGAYITRNASIASDITWEWDYDPLEANAIGLATGEWNTCAVGDDGLVYCWGRNGNGQIGNGQTSSNTCGNSGHKCKDVPTATSLIGSSGDDIVSIAFGHQHACALLDTGDVECWGRNNAGQLGQSGGDEDKPQPVNLGTGRTATSIYAGGHYSCAILDDESVKCWGQNTDGQLGIGSTSNTNTPTTINTLGSGRTAVTLATAFSAVCALLDDGSVKCWGDDYYGQLGNAGSNTDLNSPPSSAINLGSGRTAKAITGGEYHFCAILDDDSIKCWGDGGYGKLGTGYTYDRSTPFATSGGFASGRYAVAIDAGSDHTCVILDNGDLTCWGDDSKGQLGNGGITGTWSSLQSTTVNLGTGRTAISLSAGGTHTCAQLDNGQLKCWGNRADGQVGDNGGFNNPSDRTSPSAVSSNTNGGNTYADTGVFPSAAVSGATCAISPSLPTGLSLNAGTCTITGTPTATASNATYTIWANVSGTSYSGQIWLEVGLNAPDISYSSSTYTYTKDSTISTLNPINVGGGVTTWAINATLPSGLSFGTSNGSIWGTPDTVTATTTYTIWANNSAGSNSTTITFTVNAAAPNIDYGGGSGAQPIIFYLNQTIQPLVPTYGSGSGMPTSCSSSPSMPSGLSISSTCVITGTPNVTSSGVFYTITATNTGGSEVAWLYIQVRTAGGALTITPTTTEDSVNSSISNITMSYSHHISNYGWSSGVSNTTTTLLNNYVAPGGSTHWLATDSGERGEMAIVYARNDSGASTYSLGLLYRWGGTWTETIIDNGTNTGYHPSVAIDRDGALHIAYIDDTNDKLRYATNASGTWVLTTLGSSTFDNDGGRGTAIVVHPITNAVHIVTTINDNTYRDLQYHTNESGSWVNETITNTSKDEGHDPVMAMDSKGDLHVAYYCDDGCSDLRLSSRINGVWQNETVASTLNIGNSPDIVIDSQDTIHIVSQYLNNKRIYLHSGTLGSWTEQTGLSGGNAHWPTVDVDSNDAVHISYHLGTNQKDVMYMTNASGSWSSATMIDGYGGWGSDMTIDDNDDIFIPNIAPGLTDLQLTKVKGSGQGLSVRPIYDISPMLPDGLAMNWRNGTIWGTPTEVLANTTFTVTVTALGTTTQGTFTLYITGAPGDIAYTDISGTKGTPITSVSPTISTNGTTGSVTTWAINASLPSGLTFETSNGTIWGTPTAVVSGEVFTIWANNSAGSKSTTVNITIIDVGVSAITYPSENITLTLYHTMTTTTPSTTGGTATSWGISPSLPAGMSFNTATGAISGTPESLQTTAVTYTIWANNSGGSFSDQINITINDYAPVPLNYFGENITLNYNQTMTPLGGFELRPDLMAAGEDHSCAIKDDGTVRCWGKGANGRLGYGNTNNKLSPTATSSLGTGRTAVDITAGGDHTCAVLDDGSVKCWGGNAFGQLGDGTTTSRTTPTQTLSLGRPAVAVEAGMYFTCALLDNGSVSCWGKNNNGQLGRGYTNSTSDLSQRTPGLTLPMPGGRHVVTMDISHYMVCGVLDDGSIACWSQYGGGKTPSLRNFFSSTNPAKDVATGRYSACGLMVNGNVTCWGTGYLGTGGSSQSSGPGLIWPNLGSGRTAVHVELGRKHNCALLDNAAVKCWGDDSYGQMANGAGNSIKNTPNSVSFASGVVVQDIIAGHWHTCIAAQTNEMYCWGDGVHGKLGDGASSQNNWAGAAAKVNHFSGTKPVKAHGDITSWAVHPALPTGLALGSTNGTIWGTPTSSISQTNFTIYGNNSGGSTSFVLNLGVNAQTPGPFQYNPENNTWTNNTEVHLAPQFINQTTGNGSTWKVFDINTISASGSLPGTKMAILVGDTIYFDANDGSSTGGQELWAYDLSNDSTWLVANIYSGSYSSSWPGTYMSVLVGDTIYFSAYDGSTGHELWAHNTSNHSTWQVADINSGSGDSYAGFYISMLVGDTLYFSANDGSTGTELWAHDTSNHSTWRVADINSGATSSSPGLNMEILTGDTLYFDATDGGTGSNRELWAHDTSNHSTWQVADISTGGNGNVGLSMSTLVGDTLYFSASDGSTGTELWAHDTSNHSTWQAANINFASGSSLPGQHMEILIGDTLYFSATDGQSGQELWAHDTSNHSTWRVADINYWIMMGGAGLPSNPGEYMAISVGDTIYFSAQDQPSGHELWAHDTSNHSTWQVADIRSGSGSGSFPGQYMEILIGDTLYFSADDGSTGYELWAHDTSNHSTWQVADIRSGSGRSNPGRYMELLVGDTVYFSADDGSTGTELWAHRPSTIDYNTNTGGNVTTWAINASLPSGVSFGTNNGTIYGTPTELWTQTSYMVWANNSGGSSVAYLNITVVDEVPTLSYSPSTLVLTKGNQSSDLPLNATLTGSGTISSWEINATLPAGLNFGTSNGTIWGIPTVLQTTATSYTIWANNSGGSSVAYLNITIVEEVANITYNPSNVTIVRGYTMANISANNTGGAVVSWSISPTLPTGLYFDNGTIYGRPLSNMSATAYTVYANNSGGSATATLTLTINEPTPNIDYSPDNYTMTNGTSYTITPTLLGQTGNISSILGAGTVSASGACATVFGQLLIYGSNEYRLWAFNTSQPSSSNNPYLLATNVTWIGCGSSEDSISYNGTLYFTASTNSTSRELWKTDGTASGTTMVKDIRSGIASSDPDSFFVFNNTVHFEITPCTSCGIEIWKTDGTSSGTVKATNSACWHYNCNFHSVIEYNGSFYGGGHWNNNGREVLMYNSSGLSLLVDLTPGQRFSIPRMTNPSNFIVHDGWLWFLTNGNPSSGNGNCLYRSNGTAAGTTQFVCDTGGYGLELFNDELYFSRSANGKGYELWKTDGTTSGTVMVKDIYTGTNSALTSAGVFTSTEDYLYFSAKTGTATIDNEVWRTDGTTAGTQLVKAGLIVTDDVLIGNVLYLSGRQYFSNSDSIAGLWSTDGTTNGTTLYTNYDGRFPEPVVADLHNLNGSLYFRYYNGSSYSYGQMHNAGNAIIGNPSSWSISPALPAGLNFGTNNGTIWGTPTALSITTQYNITATNANGSSTTSINITINDQLPTLSYSPSSITLTKGQSSTDLPLNATVTGSGTITSWAISPSLPSGLNFGTSNGTIWGTPTSLMTFKTFTIWANNSGGSSSATVNITIDDEVPDISYSPDWFELTKGTAMSPTATPTNAGGAIPSTVIDSTGDVGEFSSIVIDSNGFKHISYWDQTNNELRYATDASGSWVVTIVDGNGCNGICDTAANVGKFSSITLNSTDFPRISYYDESNSRLKYAVYGCVSGVCLWITTSVDNSGDVGHYTSLVVDSNDHYHISYYDNSNDDLKYATSTSGSWVTTTVDSSGNVGKYGSIAIDSNDAVHISYRDSTNDDLKYATCSSSCTSASSWTNSTIDSVGNVGSRTSIAIDSNDAVHISYHDITNGDLKYATDQSGSWANTTVDSVGTVGQYTSIAIDSNDVVHISYYDASTKDLKYASNMQSSIQTGVGNVIKFIDRVGEVGRYSSLAVDSNGDVHISYYGATNGDLKYAALQGVHPWNVYGYSISPALPAGLSLNFTSGEISGTPTAVSTNTTYTITVRNTGGANTTTITIVVNDVAPSISYSNDDIVGTLNVSISPHSSPTNSGGAVTSWEISPDPGPAFHFNTVNGVISGTPGILLSKTQYTVYANNSGGSSIAYVNVTINPDAPNIAYSPDELNLTKYQSSSDLPLSPTNTGGNTQTAALSCSSSDKLFVVSDHEGTRHVLCGITLRSVALNGTQTVSNNIVTGTAFGLEIDDDGHLHIGHWTYNYPYVYIHHATNKNGSWQSSNVFNFSYGGSVGYDSQGFSMAVGSDDSIHFTYIRVTSAGNTYNLYHLSNQSGSWSSALLTNSGKPSMPSLALNDDNVPHVAFSAGNSVGIGKYENGSYTTLLSRSNYLEPEIAIDAQGDVHVVYRTGSNGLYYSTNASGSWQHTTLDTTERHFDVRIALDSNDYPHVMTVSITGQFNNYRYVNHYSHDGSSWNGGNITSEMPLQQPRPDLFIDDDDVISMVYHDGSSASLFTGTGSTTYGYSISPALPSGLKFSQSTGTISGTATVQMNRTMFTITVQNSGGSSTAYINITVNDRMPSFTYSPENLTLTNNTVSSDLPLVPTIHYSADSPTDWVLMGTLPAGLNFGTNNGTIWGTATELWATTNYTVYGNNTGGSFNVSINITVTDQVPTLSFSPENLTLTRGQSSSDLPLAPTLSGPGEITSWSINATLPNGLFLGPNNGTLYGIATVNMTMTAYTIYANNSGGSASTQINITILEPIVILDYNPENLTLVRSDAMTTLHPTVTGGDAETWGIHPSIPAGLNFADGVLSGTPTVNLSTTMFTIYANTTGGSATHTINITILEPIVTVDYNPENFTLVRSIAMTALHPTVTGGSVETWEIHPSIPAGLNFADGVLSGTPTVNMTLTMFTIYANTTGGSASHTINLTILEPGVILDYNPENQTMTRGVAMVTMTPTVTNGTAETWSIDPLLPSGLNFNNGVISGTPTVNMTRTMFTVWANTTGGASFHTINLTILEPIVGLDYNPENLTLTRGVAMADLHPIVTGGNVSEWGISPNPLSGLTFAEGLLYGTPGINQTTPIMYTIYANTTGGSITHTINITVLEPLVDLFYNPENQTFIRTEQAIAWSPTVSGGLPETWAIEPALPNGLVFDNGTISGSPTVNLTTTQYTVWANNSGGSASTSINITINEPAPEIEYDPSDLVLTRGTAMTTLQPNVTGGLIDSWEIEPAIPNGLSFVDGVISGTPTAIQNQTQYVVWANNSGGSLMAYLNITILDIVPEISYTPENMTLTNDTSVVDWLPVNIGGPALTWSISPALSEGLEFNETTGHITGTPTEVMDVRTYVVTATNSGGFASTQINITVLDQVPIVTYVPDDVVLLNNSTVLTMEAISTGGIVTSWSILPDPSPGLLFDTTNGTLSGVATQVQNRTMYVITASNDVGSITVFVNVTVEDLFYNMSLGPLYLLNNSEMVALEPELIISGSTFEIEPDLPEGLFFGADNGTIWGTPTELMDLTNFTIYANSSLFNDEFVVQIGVLEDTDRDGLPNELPGDADPRRGLIEDLDDDGDGYADLIEGDCLSNPLDSSDVPADLDGDFICNAIDDDIDGDGLNNTVETNTSAYVDANNTGTDPWDADTDGDGICDGPIAPALPVDYCEAGPDAFPNDAAAYLDTDGDGMPDELFGESTTGLIEDLDDDNDNWTDLQEADCGPTDSMNEFDTPVDSDGDGICDFNEVLSVTYGTGDFELLQGQRNVTLQPLITGMTVDIWEISPALPYGLFFGGDTMARTANGNGTIYGVPLVPWNLTKYTVTATNLLTGTQISTTFNLSIAEDYDLDGLPNNATRLGMFEADFDDDGDGFNDSFELECGGDPYNRSSVPKIESDGTCYDYRSYEEAPEQNKNPFKPICFPIIFLVLAFILVVPMILTRRKERVGVQAEHISATPAIQSGSGTMLDPFILKAVKIPYNTKTKTEERIRCSEMSPSYEVTVRETNLEINKRRFGAIPFGGVQDGTGVLKSNSDGLLMLQFTFDGTLEPSKFGMVYKSELILDDKTYFVWHVETGAKKGK